jgi:hypothetical protein
MGQRGLEITKHAVYKVYSSWSENVMSWTRKTAPGDLRHAV